MVNYINGITHFLPYFLMSALLMSVFWSIYTYLTPHDEVEMIEAGNVSASVMLLGALLGFAIPVAAAITHSVSTMALLQWGLVAMLVQLAVYALVRLLFPRLHDALVADRLSVALLVAGITVISGLLNAAAMSYK